MHIEETLDSSNPDKQVIMACIFLSNALKSAYGQKGTEMAKRMVNAIDPDLKNHILETVLVGNTHVTMKLRDGKHVSINKIMLIKQIRNATGMLLRDAKLVSEKLIDGQKVSFEVTDINEMDKLLTICNDNNIMVV